MSDTARLWVRGYLGCVYAAGAAALGWVITRAEWHVSAYLLSLVSVVALLMIASEFMPIRVWSRGRFQEYTFSGAFAVVLLQIAPLEWAVLPQAIAVLVEEMRQRRPAKAAAFNVAQNILMFVLARMAMDVVATTPHVVRTVPAAYGSVDEGDKMDGDRHGATGCCRGDRAGRERVPASPAAGQWSRQPTRRRPRTESRQGSRR